MSPNRISAIRRKLLSWYDQHHRDLPWRRSADPYAIWISETMLQQTQVTTVVPYYNRFLKRFPNVASLARAPLARVLAVWSGLGYYRRAENLRRCAQQLVRHHGGCIPADYHALVSLPGIGHYTAGALMSIGFGQSYPALDGNARRVLGRIANSANEAELKATATKLVSTTRPGCFNQAVMELGATLCLPKKPRCGECPVASHCSANRLGAKPTARKSRTPTNVIWPVAIVRRGGKLLLRRRGTNGMLAGLWEFPGGTVNHESVLTALARHVGDLKGALPSARRIGELRHAITDKKIRAPIFLLDLPPDSSFHAANQNWRWIAPSSVSRYAVSSMTLKAAQLLASHEKRFA
jgi:A/G-specific adenine glycosylase